MLWPDDIDQRCIIAHAARAQADKEVVERQQPSHSAKIKAEGGYIDYLYDKRGRLYR
jgi:hypothetical protein